MGGKPKQSEVGTYGGKMGVPSGYVKIAMLNGSMLPNGGGGLAQHFIAIKQVFPYKM